jgi:hypothetical protein
MKAFFGILACALLLPVSSHAVYLVNCDLKPYNILLLSDGQESHITLKYRDSFSNYNPVFSFQVQGFSPVMLAQPNEQFCIWHEKVIHKIMCNAKDETNKRNLLMLR